MQDIVYVLVNEAMPNYVKLGSTAIAPADKLAGRAPRILENRERFAFLITSKRAAVISRLCARIYCFPEVLCLR